MKILAASKPLTFTPALFFRRAQTLEIYNATFGRLVLQHSLIFARGTSICRRPDPNTAPDFTDPVVA